MDSIGPELPYAFGTCQRTRSPVVERVADSPKNDIPASDELEAQGAPEPDEAEDAQQGAEDVPGVQEVAPGNMREGDDDDHEGVFDPGPPSRSGGMESSSRPRRRLPRALGPEPS